MEEPRANQQQRQGSQCSNLICLLQLSKHIALLEHCLLWENAGVDTYVYTLPHRDTWLRTFASCIFSVDVCKGIATTCVFLSPRSPILILQHPWQRILLVNVMYDYFQITEGISKENSQCLLLSALLGDRSSSLWCLFLSLRSFFLESFGDAFVCMSIHMSVRIK